MYSRGAAAAAVHSGEPGVGVGFRTRCGGQRTHLPGIERGGRPNQTIERVQLRVAKSSVGTNGTAHPAQAATGPYLPPLSLAPSARQYLRQEPYAGNLLLRICAGGTEQSVFLARHRKITDGVSHPMPGERAVGKVSWRFGFSGYKSCCGELPE